MVAPACSLGIEGNVKTPRVEKKLRKSMTGPASAGEMVREPTHSTEAIFFPARSAACWIVSACNSPVVAKLVRLLKVPSPIRWNVLFIDPCSPGYVPVARVDQPTPVFGGKAWINPLSPRTPFASRSA